MQAVLNIMEALITEHERMLNISNEKTELMKAGKIDALQKLLIQERKQTQAIRQLENKRVQAVDALFQEMGIENTDKTVTVLLEQMEEGQQKREMEPSVSRLIDYIVQIREVNKLNKELIQQSITFEQLHLEMWQPTLAKRNYEK